MAAGTFAYCPIGSTPWQFSGTAGISSNGSNFTSGNPNAPDGSQVAFLQATGSISQSILLDAGTYSLSLLAAQRAALGGQAQQQEIQVWVDGTEYGQFNPVGTEYTLYQTTNFTITTPGQQHTIQLVGVDPLGGDNTAFVDAVMLQWQGAA